MQCSSENICCHYCKTYVGPEDRSARRMRHQQPFCAHARRSFIVKELRRCQGQTNRHFRTRHVKRIWRSPRLLYKASTRSRSSARNRRPRLQGRSNVRRGHSITITVVVSAPASSYNHHHFQRSFPRRSTTRSLRCSHPARHTFPSGRAAFDSIGAKPCTPQSNP